MSTNELGQEILFEHHKERYGSIEFAAFHGKRNFAIAVRDNNDQLAKYMGLGDQADILALGKAILNAMEPEALVENQKPAEPEPYKPQVGDWVKVADTPTYNRRFRDQTLQVVDPGYRVSDFEVVVRGTDGYDGMLLVKDVTPASAPTPTQDYDIPALVAAVANLEDRVDDLQTGIDAVRQSAGRAAVDATTANIKADRAYDRIAALELAADTEIRVGDTVRVEPDDWNIGGAWCGYETLVGEVVWVAPIGQEWGSRYHVKVTARRGAHAGTSQRIYAAKATKVVSRG